MAQYHIVHVVSDCTKHTLDSPTPQPSPKDTPGPEEHIWRAVNPPRRLRRMALKDPVPRCLFFDVFGTCVDWRKTVTNTLWSNSWKALNSGQSPIASHIRFTASQMTFEHWGDVAQEWRNSYLTFTREIANDSSKAWKTVDEHHLDALRDILTRRGLLDRFPGGSLWSEQEIVELSLTWHRLDPWPDTCEGIQALNTMFWTCTLSNGNLSLLEDMATHAKMDFTHLFSAEMFKSYKPSPKVYLGAAEKLDLEPAECCMVAAHLEDLKAAKSNGFRTVYVERPQEERAPELRDEGFVDVWVKEGEGGFLAVAERLGVQLSGPGKVEA